jgi:hypothetical protein
MVSGTVFLMRTRRFWIVSFWAGWRLPKISSIVLWFAIKRSLIEVCFRYFYCLRINMDGKSHWAFLNLHVGEVVLAGKGEIWKQKTLQTLLSHQRSICSFPSFKEFTDLSPNNYPIYSQIDHKNLISKKPFNNNL